VDEIGRIECMSRCSEDKDSLLCVATSKAVWKVELKKYFKTGQYLWEGITAKRDDNPGPPGTCGVVATQRHHIYVDSQGAVWSKGEVPYCGFIHNSQTYQRIAYLSAYHVTQLQAGADFAACIAKPKQVVSPDTPAEDEPDDATGKHIHHKSDLISTTHDSLSSQNSCPLGIRLTTTSPGTKTARAPDFVKSDLSSSVLSSSDGASNASKGENIIPRTDSASSALLAEFNHDLDEPQLDLSAGGSSGAGTESEPLLSRLSLDPSQKISKDDLYVRSSPVSLDDIQVSMAGKSCSEPPPSNLDESQGNIKRSSSLILSIPKSLNYCKKALTGPGEAVKGEDLWLDEIWTWGEGGRGQLGQGDMLARPNPVPVLGLHNQFIVKISVGSQHMLMLTGGGRVYGWGHNSSGQSNPGDQLAVVLCPALIHLPRGEAARDIQAVGNISLILSHSGNLFYAGLSESGQKKNRLQCIRMSELISSPQHHPSSILCTAVSTDPGDSCTSPKYVYLMNLESLVKASAGRLAAAEKQLLDKVETVANLISQLQAGSPCQKKVDATSPVGRVWYWLIRCRNILSLSLKGFHVLQQQSTESRWTGIISDLSAWVEACTELGFSIGTCICVDCLMLDSDQAQHQHNIVSILLQQFGWKQQNIKGQIELEQLLLELFNLNLPYMEVLELTLAGGHMTHILLVKQAIATLKSLQQTLRRQKADSESTRLFWETNTDSRLQSYRTANQRLILDSKNTPVSLASAFSTHRFILFSDILIDIGYNKVNVHPLSTVWVDALPLSKGAATKPQIGLTMPEGTKILVCNGLDTKNLWLRKLNETVYRELTGFKQNLTTSPNIPITRAVTFTYTKSDLKGCEYNGAMTQGRMHGKGRLSSPDGGVYTGSWRNDIKHGWGEFKLPNGTVRAGTWIEGHLTGPGSLKFPDGSEYNGDLVDGEPHGHGNMKSGRFVGDGASMYTGSWSHGTRHGYGVLEDTQSGERYMGTWNEGLRHGQGCVVNSDGIYYEGNFVTDRLSGPGIIIFEDEAIYEGEFCGAGEFYGSGVLTTKTEKFQGTFYGSYSDGMKFNGTVYRHKSPEDSAHLEAPDVVQRYSVPSHHKWTAIFEKIASLLCVPDGKCAWENLSVQFHQNKIGYLEGRGEYKERGICKSKWQGFDILETIPKVAKTLELTWQNYCDIREYLVTANTCPIHPVHKVVAMLVNCFNVSYGGLLSHPTLLPHAKDELEDMSSRLYAIIRNLFPCLPSLTLGGQIWLSVQREVEKETPDAQPNQNQQDHESEPERGRA
jgi:amyotrophic lateral sclerosis 2 protein